MIEQVMTGGAPMTPEVARKVLAAFATMEPSQKCLDDYDLTLREREILRLMADGLLKKEIAEHLDLSVHTVSTHLHRVYGKLHVQTNTGAVAKALREKIILPPSSRGIRAWSLSAHRDEGRGGHQAMADIVHHHTKAFQSSHPEQCHVAGFRENHFIVGFVAFGAQDGVAHLTLDPLLGGGSKYPLAARGDPRTSQHLRRQPCEFRDGVNQRLQGRGRQFLTLGIAGNHIDFENAHGAKLPLPPAVASKEMETLRKVDSDWNRHIIVRWPRHGFTLPPYG
jgi:DNA-binding CsgD family transcriptional regulator